MSRRAAVTVTAAASENGSRPAGHVQTDLMSRYQDYVERMGASSRATRQLYDQLLGSVAAGELEPRALDRGLNHFLQVNGPEYATRLGHLSMRFLAGVVHTGSRSSYEVLEAVAPGAADPVPEPPTFDPTDSSAWLERLTVYAEQARTVQTNALRVVMDRVASGELDPETVERSSDEQSRQQAPDSMSRLAELYVEMLTDLEEMSSAFGMDYLRSLMRRFQKPESIELAGDLGEHVQVRVVVSNDQPDEATMRCTITDLRREDGIGPAFEPEVVMTPERFELAPDAETRVSCSVAITPAFAPGATYVGELRVLTGTDTALVIPVRIRANERDVGS